MFFRLLFLLLIALNVGVAAWLAFGHPVRVAPPPADPGVAELKLLSERDGKAAAAAPAKPERARRASDRCLAIGPFDTQSDTRAVVDALTPHVPRIQFRQEQTTQSTGWWVYLPAFPSRDDALATARRLSAKGVHDYYVVTAGDRQNTISLGLFHDPDNARRRQQALVALGFQPKLSERTETLPQYWVDIAMPAAAGFDWHRYVDRPGVGAQAVDCF